MRKSETRKELIARYKEREVIGGVYAIKNMLRSKLLLQATVDLNGSKNRFEFAQSTGSCIETKLQKDWSRQNGEHFVFEVLETLKKGETQTAKEFEEDVNTLLEMWQEKYNEEELY